MNNELYVIGNGFDLHHGMPSSYNDFGDYLKINDYYTYSNIEKYLGVHGKFWGEFEDGLSLLDADSIMDDCNMFLMSYGDDDWSDSGHHDYQYEISRIVESIVERMPFHFSNWVRQIPVPNSKDIGDSRLPLNKNAYFFEL
ncbi:hypothetical protein LHK_01274 [Laribacter hongkongensis HLHK9]|uniref:Bacteriophage abortive infection AbiH n=1 Tax=Laribacter hongkongensis (strain HLHK9) TaxID=557598 RepID=C1D724_LARHH|nr:AbiH family protein [Laribacter hongkongensis]ACO74264.1 hypothetical protein LHK_01274 [Laribacter hongkongensis HLHK9]